MGKAGQPAWVKRILKLLEQARTKDKDLQVFGAYDHKYQLKPPASEEAVQALEVRLGVQLPEEYRDFLMLMGNGGVGPYYGIYSLEESQKKLQRISELYSIRMMEPVIYPKMCDEDWNRAVDSGDRRNRDAVYPYDGILPIGSQGCTLMTGLVLKGPYRGQVVYYDDDFCGKPFFVREKGFLAWYERWLREVIAGYDDEETGFGINVDGNPRQLMELYEQTEDPEEKIEIIDSYYKFETLPGKQKTYFKQTCAQESNMEVRMKLVKMMAHFHVPGMAGEIERLWEYGAYAEAVSVINGEGGREVKEAWYERIFEKMPELHGDGFQDACYIFIAMKNHPDVHAGRLREALAREDLERNDRNILFHCIGKLNGKEEVLDYFLDYLSKEEDPRMLTHAVQAMGGVKEWRLQELYIKLLDKYRIHENAKLDYKGSQMVFKNGCCMGAHRPEGVLVSNLMNQFDQFGLDYRGAWKLLMNDGEWKKWKQQNGSGQNL